MILCPIRSDPDLFDDVVRVARRVRRAIAAPSVCMKDGTIVITAKTDPKSLEYWLWENVHEIVERVVEDLRDFQDEVTEDDQLASVCFGGLDDLLDDIKTDLVEKARAEMGVD